MLFCKAQGGHLRNKYDHYAMRYDGGYESIFVYDLCDCTFETVLILCGTNE